MSWLISLAMSVLSYFQRKASRPLEVERQVDEGERPAPYKVEPKE